MRCSLYGCVYKTAVPVGRGGGGRQGQSITRVPHYTASRSNRSAVMSFIRGNLLGKLRESLGWTDASGNPTGQLGTFFGLWEGGRYLKNYSSFLRKGDVYKCFQ